MTKKQRQYSRAKVIFSANVSGTTGYPHAKKINLDTDITSFSKINRMDHWPKYKTFV